MRGRGGGERDGRWGFEKKKLGKSKEKGDFKRFERVRWARIDFLLFTLQCTVLVAWKNYQATERCLCCPMRVLPRHGPYPLPLRYLYLGLGEKKRTQMD